MPEVYDFLTVAVHAARSAELAPAGEVLKKCLADGLKALRNVSVNFEVRDN